MNEQKDQQINTVQDHSHKGLYSAIVVSGGVALVLFMVVVILLYKKPGKLQQTQPYQSQIAQTQQQANSVQTKVQQVTPAPIASKKDLNTALQQLDAADTSQVSTGLNQNTQDTAGFSQ
ncbi:MAG TPA: hypothetical protein VND99_03245 [Candidatus Acidoferrales bacterium]|nr:hypothetical protein [Candidatus Acidoferrales bacterium]